MVFWQLKHQSHSLQIDNLIYSSSLTQFFTVGVKYASVCGGGNYYKCATWTLRRKSKRKHCCVFFLIWRCGMSNLNILCHILYCYSPLCVAALRHFEQKKVLQHTGPSNGIWINFARWCKIAATSSSLLHPSLHQFAWLFFSLLSSLFNLQPHLGHQNLYYPPIFSTQFVDLFRYSILTHLLI